MPEDYNVSVKDLLEIESPYHSLTNGGHYTRVELANKLKGNSEQFEKTIRLMKESGIGFGKIELN